MIFGVIIIFITIGMLISAAICVKATSSDNYLKKHETIGTDKVYDIALVRGLIMAAAYILGMIGFYVGFSSIIQRL